MLKEQTQTISCEKFEELLTDYIDKTLNRPTYRIVAEHALKCPLCHGLLNDVKSAVAACRTIAEPRLPLTRLEARILERTVPNASLACNEFEEYLTDYLDGFLPAQVFHRWERHAVLCNECTDLPGAVVRTLAAVVAYKLDELPVPEGLHARIMQQTVGTVRAKAARASVFTKFKDWASSLSFPIAVPQLASVAFMTIFAFLVFSQTVSADGSISGVYEKGYELAELTYKQGVDAFDGKVPDQATQQEPVTGATYVDNGNEEKK
ncbi:MAG TPA: zf-HC2 domain-containing protein [Pyrinomonadaceae bacterium]|jgi:anti-sigma factor RsiW|nr:zf-HC2 domain-containing protein [Pyrinomonadaceae bacterium]